MRLQLQLQPWRPWGLVIIAAQAHATPELLSCLPGGLHATNERVPLIGGEAQDRAVCVFGVTDPKATFRQHGDLHAVIG